MRGVSQARSTPRPPSGPWKTLGDTPRVQAQPGCGKTTDLRTGRRGLRRRRLEAIPFSRSRESGRILDRGRGRGHGGSGNAQTWAEGSNCGARAGGSTGDVLPRVSPLLAPVLCGVLSLWSLCGRASLCPHNFSSVSSRSSRREKGTPAAIRGHASWQNSDRAGSDSTAPALREERPGSMRRGTKGTSPAARMRQGSLLSPGAPGPIPAVTEGGRDR